MDATVTDLISAVRTLEASPYDAAAMRIVSHSLLVDVEAARAMVRAEYAAEAMKGVA